MLTADVRVNGARVALLKVRNTSGAGDAPRADYSVELRMMDESKARPGETFRGRLAGFSREAGAVALVESALGSLRTPW